MAQESEGELLTRLGYLVRHQIYVKCQPYPAQRWSGGGGVRRDNVVQQDKFQGLCFNEEEYIGGKIWEPVFIWLLWQCLLMVSKVWDHGGDAFWICNKNQRKKISAQMYYFSFLPRGCCWGQQFLQWKSNSSSSISLYPLLSSFVVGSLW